MGGMIAGALNSRSGRYTITGKALAVTPAVLIVLAAIVAGFPVAMFQGGLIIA